MGLIEKNTLLDKISPPMDHLLASQLVDEFISMEKRFIQRDWEPTELDAGQFAEITARILYHMDSGNLNYKKGHAECIDYFENSQVSHKLNRQETGQLSRILQGIYKMRSQRGAVHISANYSPNHMDSKYVMEAVRWCMNELLRIFWRGNREEVAKVIRELLQFDVPCIGVFEDCIVVQRTDLRAEEEILMLLHYAGEKGFSRTEIGKHSMHPPSTVSVSLQHLCGADCRQIVKLPSGPYRLTDLGSRRIRTELAEKLLVE
jgi:hypothetical protein